MVKVELSNEELEFLERSWIHHHYKKKVSTKGFMTSQTAFQAVKGWGKYSLWTLHVFNSKTKSKMNM